MAGKQRLQNRMQQEIRRRQKQARPKAVETGNVRRDRWHEITDRHFDILQNIEFAIVAAWKDLLELDDLRIHQGLKAAMLHNPPDDTLAFEVFSRVEMMRQTRADIGSELWLDALRVVDQSVRDHSSLKRGDCSYLAFVTPYVAPAMGLGNELAEYEVIEGRIVRSDLDAAEESIEERKPRLNQSSRGE